MKEIWKPVLDFQDYSISNLGRLRRETKGNSNAVIGKILRPCLVKGYPNACLYRDGKKYFRYVHWLVLESFGRLKSKGSQARHLNDIKTDNRDSNLCWGSKRDNTLDAIKNGTFIGSRENSLKGWITRRRRAK